MKSNPSALHSYVEPSGEESADLDETATLPALFIAGDLKDRNDDDAGPSPRDEDQSLRLIELGESINRNLERIATALENLPSKPGPRTRTRKVAAKPATSRKKKARKVAAKPATSRKKKARKTKSAT
jgi:hypothetical protein